MTRVAHPLGWVSQGRADGDVCRAQIDKMKPNEEASGGDARRHGAKNDVWIPAFAGMTVLDYEFTVTLGLKWEIANKVAWRERIIDSDIAKSGPTFSIIIDDVHEA